MVFKNLESSIRKNVSEEPSLYMAMCLIESLFKDIEGAAGTDLISVPQGNEMLPVKMTLIERKLLSIYDMNKGSFQRGTEKLAEKTKVLREQQVQLEKLGDISVELNEAKRQEAALSEQLSEALAQKKLVDELEARCKEHREKISSLEKIDPKKANEQLSELKLRLDELESERGTLTEQIGAYQQKIADLNQKNKELRESEVALKESFRVISNDCTETEASIRRTEESIQSFSGKKDGLVRRLEAAQKEQIAIEQEISEISGKISSYELSTLKPERDRLTKVKEQQAGLEQQTEDIQNQFQAAVSNVGRLNELLPKKRAQLEQKTAELQEKENLIAETNSKIQGIKEILSQKYEELNNCQAEYSRLSNSELPEADRLLQMQIDQNQECKNSIIEKQKEIEDLKKKNEEKEKKLFELNEEWKTENTTYQTLDAQVDDRDNSIRQLRENIEKLRNEDVKGKTIELEKQLQAENTDLQNAKEKKEQLKIQINAAETELEKENNTLSQLASKKTEFEEKMKTLQQIKCDLSSYTAEEYQKKIATLEEQITFLKKGENSIKSTMRLLQKSLQKQEWEDQETLLASLGDQLDSVNKYLSKIGAQLLECANIVHEGMNKRRPM